MRFPLRLSLALTRALTSQKILGTAPRPLILQLNLADLSADSDVQPNDGRDSAVINTSRDLHALALVRANAAPIVWIGGDTPLHYPRIGHIARDIINSGRTVFVEMDGLLLRRRIHEFRPVSRLYLVLPLNGLEAQHDARAGRAGNFHATVESIRTAKLSGFHVCVETTIFADTHSDELHELAKLISKLDVDGWIQTRPGDEHSPEPSQPAIDAALALIPHRQWRSFSRLLDVSRSKQARSLALRESIDPVVPQIQSVPDRQQKVGAL
jgi:MoaA/NifB/PqqE/SkfB family radical SAM enzyme